VDLLPSIKDYNGLVTGDLTLRRGIIKGNSFSGRSFCFKFQTLAVENFAGHWVGDLLVL
jgi:hypothetical protein